MATEQWSRLMRVSGHGDAQAHHAGGAHEHEVLHVLRVLEGVRCRQVAT